MRSKTVLISEAIAAPFDEGLKNVLFNLMKLLQKNKTYIIVTKIGNRTDGFDIQKIKLNKFFLNSQLYALLEKEDPHIILYVPEASCTFNSFIRARILRVMCRRSRVVMLGVQHRFYTLLQSVLISKFLRPDLLFLLSNKNESFYKNMGINVQVLPPAVDRNKFYPADMEEKLRIREKYNLPAEKKIILHVGHIKVNRNIENLLEVQNIEGVQVVIVGSTAFKAEFRLKEKLTKAGIHIIDQFIPDISEIYRMSDIYVFPVKSSMDAIDMPMSVLEAVACNLPVITTRFQGLIEHFQEDESFKYFDNEIELAGMVKDMIGTKSDNCKKMKKLTWEAFSDEMINTLNKL